MRYIGRDVACALGLFGIRQQRAQVPTPLLHIEVAGIVYVRRSRFYRSYSRSTNSKYLVFHPPAQQLILVRTLLYQRIRYMIIRCCAIISNVLDGWDVDVRPNKAGRLLPAIYRGIVLISYEDIFCKGLLGKVYLRIPG